MELTSSIYRQSLALAVGGAGFLVWWFTREPVALLVPVAASCIWLGWLAGLAVIASAGLMWIALLYSEGQIAADNLTRFLVFIGVGVGIWLLVQVFRSATLFDALDQSA